MSATRHADPTHRTRWRPVRSTTDRVVAGVAGGLAEQLRVDPVLIRLAFVVLAFAGGAGLLLYALGWLFGAEQPATAAGPGGRTVGRSRAEPERVAAFGVRMQFRQHLRV